MSHAATEQNLISEEIRRYHHFITLALWLAAITGVEIVLIFLPVSLSIILAVLCILSAIKFFAVILWFMHLIYDHRLLFWIFITGMGLTFATFTALLALFTVDRVDTKWFS
jgi:cytochrome c oxidase subunit IV